MKNNKWKQSCIILYNTTELFHYLLWHSWNCILLCDLFCSLMSWLYYHSNILLLKKLPCVSCMWTSRMSCHCYMISKLSTWRTSLMTDKVVLEFNQYDPGSRWRETIIWRSNHREIGDGVHGFFGGIRKIYNKYEISMWQQHWPPEAM